MYNVSLTNFKLDHNKMTWKLNDVSFKITYNFKVSEKFSDTFKLIPIIQACCLASSYNDEVTINSNIKIKDPMISFIKEYLKSQYVFNMDQLDIKIVNEHPEVNLSFPKDSSTAKPIENIGTKNVVSAWSGGKDSYLTIKLLEECGYKVNTATTRWNTIAFNRGAYPFLNNHNEIKENIIASIALGNKMKKIFTEALREQDIYFKKKQSGTFNDKKELPMILYHSFYMNVQNINNILYGMRKDINSIFMGDEADVNTTATYCDFKKYENVGQGYNNKKLINNYLKSIYDDNATQIYSLLYPIHGPLEIKMLIERYNTVKFSSCLTMINTACSTCPKCLLTYLSCKSLGYDPKILGINENKLIKNFKWKLGESFLMPSENLVYWYIKQCIHNEEMKPILQELLDEIPTNTNFNPLIPLEHKYKTIPKFIREKIIKIYNEYV